MGLFSNDDLPGTGSSEITVISEGLKIFGEIAAKDNVYINGTFTGKIVAKGEIAVGPKGRVEGTVHATTVRVAGIVDGNIECTQLSVLPSGKVYGELRTSTLEIHPGGFVDAEHRQRSADQEAPTETGDSGPSAADQDAVVTPLHSGRDGSRWALKKFKVQTYRKTDSAHDKTATDVPDAATKSASIDDRKFESGRESTEKKRWHGSHREAS